MCLLIGILLKHGMANLILEYLKVILTAPVIAGVAVVLFLCLFKADIRALMRRIATIKFPGGGELSTSQSERIEESKPAPTTSSEEPELPPTINLSKDQFDTISNIFKAQRTEAALWEARYLNLHLVHHSQRVLDWFVAQSGATTLALYDSTWLPFIPDANERVAILRVLCSHHLVEQKGTALTATPKGKEYTQWRGPLATAR